MQLKQYNQYKIDFRSKWIVVCAALMGLSFFLRFVYYFGFMNLADVGFKQILFSMILGIALSGTFVVLITCLHINAPGLYGILGAACCLLLIIGSFSTGSAFRMILSIVWYLLCGIVLLMTVAGFLPGRVLSSVVFFLAAAVRLLFYDLGHINIWQWAGEAAALCMICGLACLPMALKPLKARTEHHNETK